MECLIHSPAFNPVKMARVAGVGVAEGPAAPVARGAGAGFRRRLVGAWEAVRAACDVRRGVRYLRCPTRTSVGNPAVTQKATNKLGTS